MYIYIYYISNNNNTKSNKMNLEAVEITFHNFFQVVLGDVQLICSALSLSIEVLDARPFRGTWLVGIEVLDARAFRGTWRRAHEDLAYWRGEKSQNGLPAWSRSCTHLQFTVYYLLFTIYYLLLFTIYCLLFTIYYIRFTIYYDYLYFLLLNKYIFLGRW